MSTPWTVQFEEYGTKGEMTSAWLIVNGRGDEITRLDAGRRDHAEFIVRAVNSFPDVLEALELAKHKAEQIRDGQCNPGARARAIIQVAAEAIEKASCAGTK